MAKKKGVFVANKTFTSIKEAAAYLATRPECLSWALKKSKNSTYKGINVGYAESVDDKTVKVRKRKKSNGCPVYCENQNKSFRSITDAARYADADAWTMSLKMQARGQFVDKNGNVYKRLVPMRTKNTYTTNSDTVTKDVKPYKHKTEDKKLSLALNVPTPVETKPEPSTEDSIKTALRDTTIKCINEGRYDWAKAITSVMCEMFDKK